MHLSCLTQIHYKFWGRVILIHPLLEYIPRSHIYDRSNSTILESELDNFRSLWHARPTWIALIVSWMVGALTYFVLLKLSESLGELLTPGTIFGGIAYFAITLLVPIGTAFSSCCTAPIRRVSNYWSTLPYSLPAPVSILIFQACTLPNSIGNKMILLFELPILGFVGGLIGSFFGWRLRSLSNRHSN